MNDGSATPCAYAGNRTRSGEEAVDGAPGSRRIVSGDVGERVVEFASREPPGAFST